MSNDHEGVDYVALDGEVSDFPTPSGAYQTPTLETPRNLGSDLPLGMVPEISPPPTDSNDGPRRNPRDISNLSVLDRAARASRAMGEEEAEEGSSECMLDVENGGEASEVCSDKVSFEHVHVVECYANYPEAKYSWYVRALVLIAVFYTLPSIQFVISQYHYLGRMNEDGDNIPADLDPNKMCRYNRRCYRYLHVTFFGLSGTIPAFNKVISNVGYILTGVVFILLIRFTNSKPRLGLPEPKGMYYAIGIALVLEGFYSAMYHLCPTNQIFQFDQTFMITGACLMLAALYAKRHARIGFNAFRVYLALSFLIIINVLNVVAGDWMGRHFWIIVVIVYAYITVYTASRVMSRDLVLFLMCTRTTGGIRKKCRAAMGFLIVIVTWAIIAVSWIANITFFTFCLTVLLANIFVYIAYYMIQKLVKRERVMWFVWFMYGAAIVTGVSSLYFFLNPTYETEGTIEYSDSLNKPCILFDYFDNHDVWHFLSAWAVFVLCLVIFVMDSDLHLTPRNRILVF